MTEKDLEELNIPTPDELRKDFEERKESKSQSRELAIELLKRINIGNFLRGHSKEIISGNGAFLPIDREIESALKEEQQKKGQVLYKWQILDAIKNIIESKGYKTEKKQEMWSMIISL